MIRIAVFDSQPWCLYKELPGKDLFGIGVNGGTTLSITTLIIKTFSITIKKRKIQQNDSVMLNVANKPYMLSIYVQRVVAPC